MKALRFEIDYDQSKIDAWIKAVYERGIEIQKKTVTSDDPLYETYKLSWDMGFPYTGASGGQFTYSFTPTSLGVLAYIKDSVTHEVLDITNMENW